MAADKAAAVIEQALNEAKQYVSAELAAADVELNKHADDSTRSRNTAQVWRTYRNNLRDYVQGDVITTVKPERPL